MTTARWTLAMATVAGVAACKEPVESKLDVGAPPTSDAEPGRRGLAAIARDVVGQVADTSADALALVPMRATIVAQLRVSTLSKVDGFSAAVAYINKEIAKPELLAAFEGCSLKFAEIESLTLAVDAKEDAVLILRGEGMGDAERWRCVKTKVASEADFDIVEAAGRVTLKSEDETGWFVDQDTFIFAETAWATDIETLLASKNPKTVRDGKLHDVIARVNVEEPVWAAAILPSAATAMLSSSSFGGTEEVWGALSVGDMLTLTVATRASTNSEATKMRDETQKQWDEVKSMASMMGVSAAVASSIRFEALEDVLSFHVEATPDDVKKIAKTVSEF